MDWWLWVLMLREDEANPSCDLPATAAWRNLFENHTSWTPFEQLEKDHVRARGPGDDERVGEIRGYFLETRS